MRGAASLKVRGTRGQSDPQIEVAFDLGFSVRHAVNMCRLAVLLLLILAPHGVPTAYPVLWSQELVRGYERPPIIHSVLVPGSSGHITWLGVYPRSRTLQRLPRQQLGARSPGECIVSAFRLDPQGSGEGARGRAAIASEDQSSRVSRISSASCQVTTATGLEPSGVALCSGSASDRPYSGRPVRPCLHSLYVAFGKPVIRPT